MTWTHCDTNHHTESFVCSSVSSASLNRFLVNYPSRARTKLKSPEVYSKGRIRWFSCRGHGPNVPGALFSSNGFIEKKASWLSRKVKQNCPRIPGGFPPGCKLPCKCLRLSETKAVLVIFAWYWWAIDVTTVLLVLVFSKLSVSWTSVHSSSDSLHIMDPEQMQERERYQTISKWKA